MTKTKTKTKTGKISYMPPPLLRDVLQVDKDGGIPCVGPTLNHCNPQACPQGKIFPVFSFLSKLPREI